MTKTVSVSAHTRRQPEKARDPFAPVLEARRKDFARKWNVELVGANDDGLAAPVADPVPSAGRQTLADISDQLAALSVQAAKIGRSL